MSTANLPYFHPEALQRLYRHDIASALATGDLSQSVHDLLVIVEYPLPDDFALRIDTVELGDGQVVDGEMSGLLVFTLRASASASYVWRPGVGFLHFADRKALADWLAVEFSPDNRGVVYELAEIQKPVFPTLAALIIRRQSRMICDFHGVFLRIPSLSDAMMEAVGKRFASQASGRTLQPDALWVQTAIDPKGGDATAGLIIDRVRSFRSFALERYSSSPLPQGSRYIYLDEYGVNADAPSTALYEDALAVTSEALTSAFEVLLDKWWAQTGEEGVTNARLAARLMREAYRQRVLDACAQALLKGEDPPAGLWDAVQGGSGTGITSVAITRKAGPGPFKLAGMMLLDQRVNGVDEVWLYSAIIGLLRFSSRAVAQAHLATLEGQTQLIQHMSFDDAEAFLLGDPVELFEEPVAPDVFDAQVKSLISMQKRNVRWVMAQARVAYSVAAVNVDDALDLSRLLDHRIAGMEGLGRWAGAGDATSVSREVSPRPKWRAALMNSHQAASRWIARLDAIEAQWSVLTQALPSMRRCAAQLLNGRLCVLGDRIPRARYLEMRSTGSAAGQDGVGLLDLFMEHVTGRRSGKLDAQMVLLDCTDRAAPRAVAGFFPGMLDDLFQYATERFEETFTAVQADHYTVPLRHQSERIDAHDVGVQMRADQLKLEIDLQRKALRASTVDPDLLEQVLQRPVALQRHALGDAAVEALELWMKMQEGEPPLRLSNAFILRRGKDAKAQSLFWSAASGMLEMTSEQALASRLTGFFRSPELRDAWFDLLSPDDRVSMGAYLAAAQDSAALGLETRVITQDLMDHLQRGEEQRRCAVLRTTLSLAFSGKTDVTLTDRLIEASLLDQTSRMVCDGLYLLLQQRIVETLLPDWFPRATERQLFLYIDIMTRYARIEDPDKDFLDDVPQLPAFAREMVNARLATDFPKSGFDADQIKVHHSRPVSGWPVPGELPSMIAAVTRTQEQTLTEFAFSHLAVPGAIVTVSSANDPEVSSKLDSPYLHRLIRELDVGMKFRAVLAGKLSPATPDHVARRRLFVDQLPAMMLDAAFEAMMYGNVSELGYDFVLGLVDMPDAMARQPVHGKKIVLRPFELIPAPGYQPDRAMGLYLIGPESVTDGPQVLHVIYHEPYSFRQFDDLNTLVELLKTDEPLQRLVLDRLATDARVRYDHGGFSEPHLRFSTESSFDVPWKKPGPPVLSDAQISENALDFLFVDTLKLLLDMATKQTVSTAEADWQSFVFLMTEAGQQALSFLPGKLGMLIAAWQSHSLFEASASSLGAKRWARGVSEFTAAISMLLGSGYQGGEAMGSEEPVPTGSFGDRMNALPDFAWRNDSLTPEIRERLASFQVRDVALVDLRYDAQRHVYHTAVENDDIQYVPVAGQVFQIDQRNGEWRIVRGERTGPKVRQNADSVWELDLNWGLRGGGQALMHLKTASVNADVDSVFLTAASGMPQIKSNFPDKARQIANAHRCAATYLVNCLENLRHFSSDRGLAPEAAQIIRDTLGMETPDQATVDDIRQASSSLLSAFLEASLSPHSSPRIVIGYNKSGHVQTHGFTIKGDPQRRLFLTERFFIAPRYSINRARAAREGFDAAEHQRAAILLHEVSHQALNTIDIAYMEASEPFVDLLSTHTPAAANHVEDLRTIRESYLSHKTPSSQLFKRFEGGRWVELSDSDETRPIILRLTGTRDLTSAREMFLGNTQRRRKVILSNADSLTLLLMRLGRRVYPHDLVVPTDVPAQSA